MTLVEIAFITFLFGKNEDFHFISFYCCEEGKLYSRVNQFQAFLLNSGNPWRVEKLKCLQGSSLQSTRQIP